MYRRAATSRRAASWSSVRNASTASRVLLRTLSHTMWREACWSAEAGAGAPRAAWAGADTALTRFMAAAARTACRRRTRSRRSARVRHTLLRCSLWTPATGRFRRAASKPIYAWANCSHYGGSWAALPADARKRWFCNKRCNTLYNDWLPMDRAHCSNEDLRDTSEVPLFL